MKHAVIVSILLLIPFTAHVTAGMVGISRRPDGVYCGEYALGLVKGRITTGNVPDEFDIWLDAFGDVSYCRGEKYVYDQHTNRMNVVDAANPKDCLGKLLVDNKLSLSAIYIPRDDTLELDLGVAKVVLSKCS